MKKKGYAKILGCCAQAKEDGFEFVVCCSCVIYSFISHFHFMDGSIVPFERRMIEEGSNLTS